MLPGVLLLAASAVLAWLSIGDRMSPLALSVVEAESAIGLPLFVPFAVVGAVLLGLALRPKPVRRSGATETKETRRRQQQQAPLGEGWRPTLDARARGLAIEPQGRIKIDEVVGVPYTLVLRNATPQQAKTRYAAFAELLSGMPTPPAARVRVESCPDIGGPIHKALTLELERVFEPGTFSVLSRSDGADIRFTTPDPRWSAER